MNYITIRTEFLMQRHFPYVSTNDELKSIAQMCIKEPRLNFGYTLATELLYICELSPMSVYKFMNGKKSLEDIERQYRRLDTIVANDIFSQIEDLTIKAHYTTDEKTKKEYLTEAENLKKVWYDKLDRQAGIE